MSKMKEIHPKYLPTRLPIGMTAVAYLLCDRFDVPAWAWGVVGTLFAIIWIGSIVGMVKNEWVKPNEV